MDDLVWRNPSRREFAVLRGLITQTDLYVWQSRNLSHTDFEQATALLGIRLVLRSEVMVNDETVAFPEHFSWVFPMQAQAMDVEDRRTVVMDYLQTHDRLTCLYPTGFAVVWYL